MVSKQLDLSNGKLSITMPDMLKLLGVVAAIGVSYAMASFRLNLIEQGIRDGQQSILKLELALKDTQADVAALKDIETQNNHALELRVQSLEDYLSDHGLRVPRPSETPTRPSPGASTSRADQFRNSRS